MNKSAIPKRIKHAFVPFLIIASILFGSSLCYAQSGSEMQNPAYLASQGWNALMRGKNKIETAEELFRKALRLDPYNAEATAGIGRIIYVKGHIIDDQFQKEACKEALRYYDTASSLDGNYEYVHYLKSEAYLCLGEYDTAIKEADLLRITPCSEHFLRAKAYLGKIKSDPKVKRIATIEAIDYLECVENKNLFNAMSNPVDLLRKTLRVTKEFKYTAGHFKKSIQSKPHSMWPYQYYYWTLLLKIQEGYLDDNDVIEADKTIKRAKIATDYAVGHMTEIHYARAAIFSQRKQYDKALSEYIKSFEANPQNTHKKDMILKTCAQLSQEQCAKASHKVIRAYLKAGDCVNAESEFNTKYKSNPTSFERLKTAVAQCKAKK